MKRTWLLVALFALLGIGTLYTLRKKNTSAQGSKDSWDMEFAVRDTNSIARIFLADRKGRSADLVRQGSQWLYNGKHKARPSAISVLLETVCCMNVRYIPPKAAEANAVKALAAEGIKVELYGKDNKLLKSYYVGDVTSDELGTYMIMDGSEQPYVVHIPGFVGQLRVRYLMGDDNWRDRMIFTEKPEQIQSISVEYPQQKSASFRLEKTGEAEYEVRPYFSTTPTSKMPQRKGTPEAYLLRFEWLGAEGFATSDPARDSVTALVPFAIVTLTRTDNTTQKVRFWPVSIEEDGMTKENFVVHYFTDVNDGSDFLITQHHVFGPIFREYLSFFGADRDRQRLRN